MALSATCRAAARVVALAVFVGLTGCGAGLITGLATSGGDSRQTPSELTLPPVMPLVPPANTTRSVVVANAQIAAAARLRVRIDALGVGVDQQAPVASGQGGSTSIAFTLTTEPIRLRVADPSAADVPGQLSVYVDDRLVAPPVPIVLARQPRAELLVEPGTAEQFVSPFGERVRMRVDGLLSNVDSALQVVVTTRDPTVVVPSNQTAALTTRLATDVRIDPPDGGAPIVSAFVPGNTFPGRVELVVRDAIAGESTTVGNAYYEPDIALALPGQGPTTGGSLLTLIGTALVPYAFPPGGSATLDFDKVELLFAKGERVTALPREDFRFDDSASDRLVFTMPPAPDGRPGQVDIVLRVDLGGGVQAEVKASQVFLFANPDPFFGPRGAVLDRLPVAIAPIRLDNAPSTVEAPDFAVLTEQGGVGFLQLLLSQQNGMFQPFAAPRQLGNHEIAAERIPRDLCVGDFDGDSIPDVFVANEGASTAVHHWIRGQARPLPPLGAAVAVTGLGGTRSCRAGRFDGDALPDVLLVPKPDAAALTPVQLLLASPQAPSGFAAALTVPIDAFAYEAVEVADLDGDGHLDVALVSGSQGKLDVAWGRGDGTFDDGLRLDFTVPTYTLDPESPAVGLHACRDGVLQSLGLVLAGLAAVAPQPTEPTITVLRQIASRSFEQPQPIRTFPVSFPGFVSGPFARSLVADLDAEPPVEMVVAFADEAANLSLGLLQYDTDTGFEPAGTIEGPVFSGAEFPRNIQALAFERAFPASGSSAQGAAVFIVHETELDGGVEKRLSTRLVDVQNGEPKLLSPDAGGQPGYAIRGLASGDFHELSVAGEGAVRDVALARPATFDPMALEGIELIANDGVGGFPRRSDYVEVPGLVPGTLTTLPASGDAVDGLLFADRTARIGHWLHDLPPPQSPPPQQGTPTEPGLQLVDAWTGELRALLPAPLSTTDLADTTTLRLGDVDGDGVLDLVALLTFALTSPQEGEAAIALLRGKSSWAEGEFPFHAPSALAPVHGNATAIALGDFTDNGSGAPRRLELAVAVPTGSGLGLDGDHVRFLHYAAELDRFVPSASGGGPQYLLAGSNPSQLAAADFDRDGLVDLLVACRGDDTLRLFRNTAGIHPTAVAVDVGAFDEGFGSPWQLAPGVPTALRLADVNGDGNLDAVALVEFTSSTHQRSTTVAIYLSNGAGDYDGPRFVSPTRIGNRDATLSGDLGDWNRDRVPDLLLGWNNTGPINLRVLFGGTK